MFVLHLDEGGHNGADGESVDVAAEDPGEEWGGQGGEDFGAEVAEDEGGDGFVVMVVRGFGFECGCAVGFCCVGGQGFRGEEWGVFKSGEVGGDHHAHAVGDGEKGSVAEDPGDAAFVSRWSEFVGQAEGRGPALRPRVFL